MQLYVHVVSWYPDITVQYYNCGAIFGQHFAGKAIQSMYDLQYCCLLLTLRLLFSHEYINLTCNNWVQYENTAQPFLSRVFVPLDKWSADEQPGKVLMASLTKDITLLVEFDMRSRHTHSWMSQSGSGVLLLLISFILQNWACNRRFESAAHFVMLAQ